MAKRVWEMTSQMAPTGKIGLPAIMQGFRNVYGKRAVNRFVHWRLRVMALARSGVPDPFAVDEGEGFVADVHESLWLVDV